MFPFYVKTFVLITHLNLQAWQNKLAKERYGWCNGNGFETEYGQATPI